MAVQLFADHPRGSLRKKSSFPCHVPYVHTCVLLCVKNSLISYLCVARMDSKTPHFRQPTPVMFEDLPDLPVDYCHKLLAQYMPKEVRMNKTYQKLFIG